MVSDKPRFCNVLNLESSMRSFAKILCVKAKSASKKIRLIFSLLSLKMLIILSSFFPCTYTIVCGCAYTFLLIDMPSLSPSVIIKIFLEPFIIELNPLGAT